MQSRYENYKLCAELKPKEICLVLEQCEEGKFVRQYHEHIPVHRLSNDARSNLLFAMVIALLVVRSRRQSALVRL